MGNNFDNAHLRKINVSLDALLLIVIFDKINDTKDFYTIFVDQSITKLISSICLWVGCLCVCQDTVIIMRLNLAASDVDSPLGKYHSFRITLAECHEQFMISHSKELQSLSWIRVFLWLYYPAGLINIFSKLNKISPEVIYIYNFCNIIAWPIFGYYTLYM